ncbi:hypothetical protein ACFP81_08175 [Deinococcus lacus]|uniref:oxoglutarate dehydrogenase (succinyl-transferring) n=1 Tax=Deinococcus lacus TaxID=392561 RepID=A0ABW1YCE2_9DEIO
MTDPQTMMSGGNAAFIEGLYEDYLSDPQSVEAEWRQYFDGLRAGTQEARHSAIQQAFYELGRRRTPALAPAHEASAAQQVAGALVTAYRVYGHISAHYNPLNFRPLPVVPELTPEYYGLSEAQLDETVEIEGSPFKGKLRDVLEQLRRTYTGSIGFEYSYLPAKERQWFQERIEAGLGRGHYSREEKLRLMQKLNAAEGLERYLHIKYVGQKRFSLEGATALFRWLTACCKKPRPTACARSLLEWPTVAA